MKTESQAYISQLLKLVIWSCPNSLLIKAWLHANRTHVSVEFETEDGSIYNAIWEVVYSVMEDKAKGWYSHCGYNV